MKVKGIDYIKEHKFITIGSFVIALAFVTVISIISNTYALDGFGVVNLSCDKTIVVGDDTITCTVTGTVADTSSVSAVSADIVLDETLTLESVTADEIWEGDGDNGDIELYTDEDKTNTFNIATFTVKSTGTAYNVEKSISIENVYFYEGNGSFEEQAISSTLLEIKTPSIASDSYDIESDYILAETKNISTIISKFELENCSAYVYNNDITKLTAGTIEGTPVLKILNGSTVIKEYDIVYIESSVYDLTKDYIISSVSELIDVTENIDVITGSLSIKNGQLVLSYNSTGIKSYDILNITSDNYLIDLTKNTMIIDEEISDNILDNISTTDNISTSISGDQLVITYNNTTVKTLDIITLTSDDYEVDLSNGYVYGTGTINTNKFSTNGSISISNNKLNINNGSTTITSLDIVSISSSKYTINDTENYIYTINTNNLTDIKSNVSVTNGTISISNNKLILKYNNITIKEYDICYVTTDYAIDESNNILVDSTITVSDFISKFTFNNLTYKLYNNSTIVTTGNITDGLKLKIYKGSTLLNTYNVLFEYLKINNLSVKDDSIIYGIKLNTTYEELLENIDTTGEITILDSSNTELSESDIVRTNSIISVKLTSRTVNYTISVIGDLTGNGQVKVGDIAKLYQNVKGKNTFTEVELLAGDVTYDGVIKIADVSKLYSYMKGKFESLD